MRSLRSFRIGLIAAVMAILVLVGVSPIAPAQAGDKGAGKKPAAPAPKAAVEKTVAAELLLGPAPKEGDEGWKYSTFSLDTSKGDVYLRLRVRSGGAEFTDLGVKVTRGPDQIVTRKDPKTGRLVKKTIPGKPEMVALVPQDQPQDETALFGGEFRLVAVEDRPLSGLVEGDTAKGSEEGKPSPGLWIVTTNPFAKDAKDRHPALGCLEMVVGKDGALSFRVWRPKPQTLMMGTGETISPATTVPAPAPDEPPKVEEFGDK